MTVEPVFGSTYSNRSILSVVHIAFIGYIEFISFPEPNVLILLFCIYLSSRTMSQRLWLPPSFVFIPWCR